MTDSVPLEEVAREEPPFAADERATLSGYLDYHRATLAMKCEGLTDEQLRRRSAEPSSLSLLGLVRHMAEVERSWFRRNLNQENIPLIYCTEDDPDGDFDNVDTADVAAAFATWRAECDRAREISAAHELDVVAKTRRREVSHRWILIHMIEEYARHNGHADLIRERIDGATGE